jgi:hypothetical protein
MKCDNVLEFPDRIGQISKENLGKERLKHLKEIILLENPHFETKKEPFNTKSGILRGVEYILEDKIYKHLVYAILQSSNSVNTTHEFDALSNGEKIVSLLCRQKNESIYLEDLRNHEDVFPFRMMILVIIKELRFKILYKEKT